jgi:hypothetical protein
VDWSLPVEPRHQVWAWGVALAAAAAVAIAILFAIEAAQRRRHLLLGPGRAALLLGGFLAACAGLVATTLWVAPGLPRADALGAAWFQQAGAAIGPLLPAWGYLASFPFLLAACTAPFVLLAARGRWPEAYTALFAGPGLAGLAIILKLVLPRAPPRLGFLPDLMSYPNEAAVLAPALATLLVLALPRRPAVRPLAWGAAALLVLAPLLSGQAWPSDTLAGLLLAAAWLCACLMGLALIREGRSYHDREPAAAGHGRDPVMLHLVERIDVVASWLVARGPALAWGLVGLGVALRLATWWTTPLGVDAFAYAAMGHAFLEGGSFTMPWGDVHSYLDDPVASQHYPPLYPVLLSGFFALLGTSAATMHVAGIATGLGAMLVTYLCSRDLYGHLRALAATAVVAVSPIFVQNTGQAYSENLVLALFVATMWAILKSLERPWYIVPAGLLAALGYLTKSSMGYFFIIAGLGGLAWRLHWKGLKVLRDPAYLAAIALFGGLVAAWAWRNWRLFGSWQTSAHLAHAYEQAFAEPGLWLTLTLVTLVFYATLGHLAFLGLLPWLPKLARTPKLESEHDSGLWLALGLPLLLTALIDAALWLAEREFYLANIRYIGFVVVPAAWLLLRHVRLDRAARLAMVASLVVLVAGSLFVAKPTTSPTQELGLDLAGRMGPDDSVGFVDLNNHFAYRYFFLFTDDGARGREVELACATDPLCPPGTPGPETLDTTWVLMRGDGAGRLPAHYVLVEDSPARFDPDRPDFVSLWRHG